MDAIKRRVTADRRGHVAHWSGRKARDLTKPIPKDTDAVVVVLDRVSHALAKKVLAEAAHRGLPVFFKKRRRQIQAADRNSWDISHVLSQLRNA